MCTCTDPSRPEMFEQSVAPWYTSRVQQRHFILINDIIIVFIYCYNTPGLFVADDIRHNSGQMLSKKTHFQNKSQENNVTNSEKHATTEYWWISQKKKTQERAPALASRIRVLPSNPSWPQQLDQWWTTSFTGGTTMGSKIWHRGSWSSGRCMKPNGSPLEG